MTPEQKLKHRERQKRWRSENPEKWKLIHQRSAKKNHSKKLILEKKYRESHKEQLSVIWKNYYSKNAEKIRQRTKDWRKANPEKVLQQAKKHHAKHSAYFNADLYQYKYALGAWSRLVRKRDKVCQICGSSENLNSHHLFPKSVYSGLSLNINNGIVLCKQHHDEFHTLNGLVSKRV